MEIKQKTYDTIIVGDGILGHSIAFSLASLDPSHSIALVGNGQIGGATQASGAMLNCFGEVTSTSLASTAGVEKFEMARRALALWPAWLDRLNAYLPIDMRLTITPGTFVVHNSVSGQLDTENYHAIVAALDRHKEPYEHADPRHIPGMDPLESYRALSALYLPKEGSTDSLALLRGLRYILKTHLNVSFIDDTALALGTQGERIDTVETAKGTWSATRIIVAAGAYSQTLIHTLPSLKTRIQPLLAGVGYSLLLEQDAGCPVEHVIRTPNRSGACGFHALPRQDNALYVGATNDLSLTPLNLGPTSGMCHFLLECTLEQLNQNLYRSNILRTHVGNRPAPIDGFPLIGPTSVEGLWLVTGTYRDGFHQSPLLADYVARDVLGQPLPFQHPFHPERPLIHTRTRSEALKEVVIHFMASIHERGIRLPKNGTHEMLHNSLWSKYKAVYDQLGTEFGLLPEMLIMLDYGQPKTVSDANIAVFKQYFDSHSQ